MSKTYRFSLVLLSAVVVFALADSQSAFGQRRGGSNQGTTEKKKDKDEGDKKDKKDRRGQNNQGNQGSQGQGGNSGNNQGTQGSSNNNQSGTANKQGNNQGNNNQGDANKNLGSNSNNQNANQNNDSPPRNFSRGAGKSGGSNNSNNSGGANNSGNPNVPSQLQPFIPGGRNQNDKDNDRDKRERGDRDGRDRDNDSQGFQGQGGQFFNPGRDGKSGNNNQNVIIGPGGAGTAQPTNRKFGSWRGDRWEGSRKADHWTEHFGGKQRLFSSQWYKDHPQAWKHDHDKTNVWVVATVPGIYSWLGWGAVPQQYAVGYGPTERFDASHYGEWYPLGVYSLMSSGEDMGTRVVQLAVDHHGHIGGNYFDMITNDDKSISGNIDRQTQRVEFWLNRNPSVRFYTSVYRLLQQPYGSITVHLPGGDQRWQFVRLEN